VVIRDKNGALMTRRVLVGLLIICLVPVVGFSNSRETEMPEFLAKAVMIEKIAIFVAWPKESEISDKSKPLVFGILGETPLRPFLEEIYTVQKKKIREKSVIIEYYPTLKKVKDCHILFISEAMERSLPRIVEALQNRPILTVGDTVGYAKKGVHINIYKKGQKVHYEINPGQMRRSSLQASFHLLKWGKVIR
jgi:hypothetical protein